MTQAPLPGTTFSECHEVCTVTRLRYAIGAWWVMYRTPSSTKEHGMTLEAWACYEAARRAR